MHYIYKITNLVNNKVYIGQTINIKKRWNQHTTAVRKNKPTQIVHHAMIKHGIDNFKFEIIASCLDLDAANDAETIIVSQENSLVPKGYNASNGGCNSPKTDDIKHKISVAKMGNLSKTGLKSSEETIEKLRVAATGKKASNETKIKISKSKLGNTSKLGKKDSEETKEKKRLAKLGVFKGKSWKLIDGKRVWFDK